MHITSVIHISIDTNCSCYYCYYHNLPTRTRRRRRRRAARPPSRSSARPGDFIMCVFSYSVLYLFVCFPFSIFVYSILYVFSVLFIFCMAFLLLLCVHFLCYIFFSCYVFKKEESSREAGATFNRFLFFFCIFILSF